MQYSVMLNTMFKNVGMAVTIMCASSIIFVLVVFMPV